MAGPQRPSGLWESETNARFQGKVEGKLESLEEDIEEIKATLKEVLKEHTQRIRMLEQFQAKTMAVLALIGTAVGAVISYLFGLFERMFKHP